MFSHRELSSSPGAGFLLALPGVAPSAKPIPTDQFPHLLSLS